MPLYSDAVNRTTAFGINEFLRSTEDVKTESYTLSAASVVARNIDGHDGQKVLQPGTVMAEIKNGAETGKIGPYVKGTAGTNEVQRLTGTTVTAGTWKIDGLPGLAGLVNTAAIEFDAVLADIQAAVDAAVGAGRVLVTGGPITTTPVNLEFDLGTGQDVAAVTVDESDLTGTIAVTTPTAGAAGTGVSDGRSDPANIVGLLKTPCPWQLKYGDLEVAVVYDASVKQGWCLEMTAANPSIGEPLSNATAVAMRPDGAAKLNGVAILFKS